MLDAMVQLMTGSREAFDPDFFAELEDCMQLFDVDLQQSQDAAWGGMIEYSDSNGQPGDEWGSGNCLVGPCDYFHEKNATAQDFHNIIIFEPCNYASNVPYYHVATQICKHRELWNMPNDYVKGLIQGFTTLAMGSALMHASHTRLGAAADNRLIDVVAYIAHQVCVSNLPSNSTVITELSSTPRSGTGPEATQGLINMFTERPVEEWADLILALDIPNYYLSFSGLVSTIIVIRFDDVTADLILFSLVELFSLPEEQKDFLISQFLPQIKNATRHIELTDAENTELEGNILSAGIKLIYAFLWQEEKLTDSPLFLNPIANVIGSTLIKYVNEYANSLNNFPVYDQPMQDGSGVYPGSEWCNPQEPHSKWHLESANGLMDLVYLSDYIFKLTADP